METFKVLSCILITCKTIFLEGKAEYTHRPRANKDLKRNGPILVLAIEALSPTGWSNPSAASVVESDHSNPLLSIFPGLGQTDRPTYAIYIVYLCIQHKPLILLLLTLHKPSTTLLNISCGGERQCVVTAIQTTAIVVA